MPAGAGFFDAQGVWMAGEDDTIDPLYSDWHNRGAESVSDQFLARRPGLKLIKPTSVAVPSGTAAINTYGEVAFAGVGVGVLPNFGVKMLGVFNHALFKKYRVMVEVDSVSASTYLDFALLDAAGALAGASYSAQVGYAAPASTIASGTVTNGQIGAAAGVRHWATLEIMNVNSLLPTDVLIQAQNSQAAGAPTVSFEGLAHTAATAWYGIAIAGRAAATITGRACVYAYDNG